MTEHEDLLRSLLVERYLPWRRDPQPGLTPAQLARTMGREKRDNRGRSRQRSRQPRPSDDRRTT